MAISKSPWRAALDRSMIHDKPETCAAFVDAIAETPGRADRILIMIVAADLPVRSAGAGTF